MGISWLKATFYEVMGNGSFGDFDACARRTRSQAEFHDTFGREKSASPKV